MEQLHLPMLTIYTGPRLVDREVVTACRTYRQAVCACWEMRTRTTLRRTVLCDEVGLYPSHVSDYLSSDLTKRELPAKYINAFEISCGNRMISQWLACQASLTILEQYIQQPKRLMA